MRGMGNGEWGMGDGEWGKRELEVYAVFSKIK
jgi:hypothetical protein